MPIPLNSFRRPSTVLRKIPRNKWKSMIPLFLSCRFNSTVTIWKTFAVLPNAASATAAPPSAHNTGKPLFFADAFPHLSKGRAMTTSLLAGTIVIVAKCEPTKRFRRLNWVKLKYSPPSPSNPAKFSVKFPWKTTKWIKRTRAHPQKTPGAVKVFLLSRNKNDATQKDDGAGN